MIKDRHSKAPKVVIFGVGGAGVSTINRISAEINNINNVNLVVVDTNPQTIKDSTAQKRIIAANDKFEKNFSGSTYAYAAALRSKEDIVDSLNGASVAFVIYGAGGEAGSNISIAIIEFAKKLKILTVALSTEPFLSEDGKRILEASSCLSIMNKTSDLQFIIDNDKLIQTPNRNRSLIDGFKMADEIWIEIINSSINFMDTHFCFSPNAYDIKEAVGEIGANLLVGSGHIKEKMLFKFKKTIETTNNTHNIDTKETHADNSKNRINHWDGEIKGKTVTPGSNWDLLRKDVMKRDGYKCSSCGSTLNLTIDHRLPLSLGGTNALSNLQTLCRDCHEDKHYCNFLDKKFDANDDYGINYRPSAKIQTIIRAVNNKSKVKINYVDRDGVRSLRVISPKKIYKGYRYQGKIVCINCVYVDAYCEKDRDDRTFRLSRMGTIDNI